MTSVAHPSARTLRAVRADELTASYGRDVTATDLHLVVITARDEIDRRAADLQAKLVGLGITDLTAEGGLVLSGLTEINPGVRRGVPLAGHAVSLSTDIGLDSLPEYFSYTAAGPMHTSTSATVVGSRVAAGPPIPGTARPATARTLVMNPSPTLAVDEAIIAVDELALQDGTELLIASTVKYLTILANRITVGTGTRITWDPVMPAARGLPGGAADNGLSHQRTSPCDHSWYYASDGGSGEDGRDGDTGYQGDFAPTVEIWSVDAAALPEFELAGGRGGVGQRGGNAGNGGNGAKGSNSWGTWLGCAETVGYGGDGGNGGDGGRGGRGGRGGPGGRVVLYLTDASHAAVLASGLTLHLEGGVGGPGEDGGRGGVGGVGGEPGDPDGTFCSKKPERAGDNGSAGNTGTIGAQGRQGPAYSDGDVPNLSAFVITEDEFLTKWTAPQVRTIDPSTVEVGDVVMITGANYTATVTVRIGGTAVFSTFLADTILQATVPPVPSGWTDVVVEIPGGQVSNPASVLVLPSLSSATPNPTVLGAQVTFVGSGFEPDCRVLFRGVELIPDSVSFDGTQVIATLTKPTGPFEDQGGVEAVSVRNPAGMTTRPIDLQMRHVLSTGFDVPTNGYAFLNSLPNVTGVADLGTFTATYGLFDATLETLANPGLTRAYFDFYDAYFNNIKAGYSSAFAMTAIDAYWSGTTNLAGEYTALSEVEDLLTIAQGHILSNELLTELGWQSAVGVARAEISLNEIEETFHQQVALPNDGVRHPIAPVMQLMPAGLPTTPQYFTDLGVSHGLLPIRIEYPVAGDPWEKRLVVYDNATDAPIGSETVIDFTRNGDTLDFIISDVDPVKGLVRDWPVKDSSNGWTLSHVSLDFSWLSPVSMPLNSVWLMSLGHLRVEDDQGRRYGTDGRQVWNDLPGVTPAVGVRNLYLLPLDGDLTFTISGDDGDDGDDAYTLGLLAGGRGRSVTLRDVTLGRRSRDTVRIARGLRDVTITTTDAEKTLTVRYDVGGVNELRSVAIEGVLIGRRGGLTLTAADNLSSIELTSEQPEHAVDIELTATGPVGARTQRFASMPIGDGVGHEYAVESWARLGPDSLHSRS